MKAVGAYLQWWRTTVVRDREIIDAVVDPSHRGPSPQLLEALRAWPGPYYWAEDDHTDRLILIRSLAPPRRERWWLHGLLFLLTFGTVLMAGALLSGDAHLLTLPFAGPLGSLPDRTVTWLVGLLTAGAGVDFAMALMAILLAHETGHYVLAKRYGIDASPPYFLPGPPPWNFIGTFGAFIRLRSPIVDRRQLMEVGVAGPWAGFALAVVAVIAGLMRSQVVPDDGVTTQFILLGNLKVFLGDSPVMYAIRQLVVGDGTVLLHPLAFAGWLGIFVTMLNLIPLGQLDGGHVLYALAGRWQARLGPVVWFGMVALGFVQGQWWWWVWAVLILVLGRGRLAHPQVLDRERRLPRSRYPLGWATVLLFMATFTPVPIHYV